jgi:medium-chain acyl-[acyl-carrier-protein] hydrolase
MSAIQLFCLPYAGGASMIFKKWERFMPEDIQLVPVEYAGRGRRSNEPLYKNVQEAVNDVYDIIARHIINGETYAIFGHSLGAMLAYETAQMITQNNLPPPLHLFFSGRGTPHLRCKREKVYHLMSEEEFQNEILNLGGTPKEFFEYPELLEYMLPVLRNDFKLSETASIKTDINPFDCEITVFIGKEEDEVEAENVHGWMLHSKRTCTVYYFNGGHFFINDEGEKLVEIMSRTLMNTLKAGGIKERLPYKQ